MLHGSPKPSAVDYHKAAYIVAAKLLGITLRPTRLDRLRKLAADVSAGSVKGGMSPRLTGSPAISKTIGMMVVAAFAARAAGVAVAITDT
jgi:hypothetical protein